MSKRNRHTVGKEAFQPALTLVWMVRGFVADGRDGVAFKKWMLSNRTFSPANTCGAFRHTYRREQDKTLGSLGDNGYALII